MERSSRIRALNDSFRQSFVGGVVMLSAGVDRLSPAAKSAVLSKIRMFSDFAPLEYSDEHDQIKIEVGGTKFSGQIEYYTRDLLFRSDDPADSGRTLRVLTVTKVDEH
ncbi:hypothetical protein TSA1_19790 [Bradyrhizobium nitroreducens]|uniref:DUF3768 domain-containing protein n=1 Tax=Bradyrhizobium nitroreducens TaxID=709803 RepID=A0A2M6UDR5_9BRAD|nr:DUF3768 domain-containing protein [Bradyrhizobium nitroreducens]PIT02744.1 hypothetical protein TSA1_19790 [Bradyrhizobium nitroreducens]